MFSFIDLGKDGKSPGGMKAATYHVILLQCLIVRKQIKGVEEKRNR